MASASCPRITKVPHVPVHVRFVRLLVSTSGAQEPHSRIEHAPHVVDDVGKEHERQGIGDACGTFGGKGLGSQTACVGM